MLQKLTIPKPIHYFLVCLFLGIIGYFVYSKAFFGPFMLDDYSLIVSNDSIKSLSNIGDFFTHDRLYGSPYESSNLYRPIVSIYYAVIYNFFGLNAYAFHLGNFLIHLFCSFLVLFIFRKLKLSFLASSFGAGLFMLHPVMTEAVSYIAGTSDILSVFFMLLAVLFFLSKINNFWKFSAVLLLTILALLSKESSILLPAILFLLYLHGQKLLTLRSLFAKKSLFPLIGVAVSASVTLLFIYLKFTIFNFTATTGLSIMKTIYTEYLLVRISTFINIIWEYIVLIFWPITLYFTKELDFYPSIWTAHGVFGLFFLLGGSLIALFWFKRKSLFFVGFFWFVISLLPFSGVIPLNNIYAEHWLYFPVVGIFILLAYLFDSLAKKKLILAIFCAIILLSLLGSRAFIRNADYSSELKFFEKELTYRPNAPLVNHELGVAHMANKNFDQAIFYFKAAISYLPEFARAHFNLANSYMNIGNYKEAEEEYYLVIKLSPTFKKAYEALYQLYFYVLNDKERAWQIDAILDRISTGEKISPEEIQKIKIPKNTGSL